MKQQLLLLHDVDALGRKGEIVSAKPGYMRNFLLPRGLAIVATPHTLRTQKRLRDERAEQALIDRKEAEALAIQMQGLVLEIRVKVDPDGHMYGSVSAQDITLLLQEKGYVVERRAVQLPRPLKVTGTHTIALKLKEGVPASIQLTLIAENRSAEVPSVESVAADTSSSDLS